MREAKRRKRDIVTKDYWDRFHCGCTHQCDNRCLNRSMACECDSDNCNQPDECHNRPFARMMAQNIGSRVELMATERCGTGLQATMPFRTGQFIIEYTGRIVEGRTITEQLNAGKGQYLLRLSNNKAIDGSMDGSIARYTNHSCEPNCEMVKWNVKSVEHIILVASRDIDPSEELTCDYGHM
ncbi:SET domain-containing protein [Amniculicola lignicola CBS 123094]|uniref:SET domain-containing protein n=1 Tax=Amniculicola lignicola CBS 123094 TaxID=1392246 RepID=A0A6A5WTU3_9PLEO|nr:SET domain-containing protein [Amniculicola lignicola CBS 123094]